MKWQLKEEQQKENQEAEHHEEGLRLDENQLDEREDNYSLIFYLLFILIYR